MAAVDTQMVSQLMGFHGSGADPLPSITEDGTSVCSLCLSFGKSEISVNLQKVGKAVLVAQSVKLFQAVLDFHSLILVVKSLPPSSKYLTPPNTNFC